MSSCVRVLIYTKENVNKTKFIVDFYLPHAKAAATNCNRDDDDVHVALQSENTMTQYVN